MKKILAGYFYRLIRGFEIWALLVLLIVASLYITKVEFDVNLVIFSEGDYFSSLDVSPKDAYRCYIECLPDDVYDRIAHSECHEDINTLFILFHGMHTVSAILILIFIPVFFGRLFSDGTIKNLIASGHSKTKIYFASLIMTFLIDLVMLIAGVIVIAVMCRINNFAPPVYIPVVLFMLLVELFVLFFVSAISMAVLFASAKRIVSLISGFIVGVYIFVPLSSFAVMTLMSNLSDNYSEREDFKEYYTIMTEKGPNVMEERFVLSEFDIVFSYEGRDLNIRTQYNMSPALKNFLIAVIYLDPLFISHFGESVGIEPYLMARDGLMAVNILCDAFWITLSSAIGLLIYKKREIV